MLERGSVAAAEHKVAKTNKLNFNPIGQITLDSAS